jgi:hypothetical protein
MKNQAHETTIIRQHDSGYSLTTLETVGSKFMVTHEFTDMSSTARHETFSALPEADQYFCQITHCPHYFRAA